MVCWQNSTKRETNTNKVYCVVSPADVTNYLVMTVDEYVTIRLIDLEGFTHGLRLHFLDV